MYIIKIDVIGIFKKETDYKKIYKSTSCIVFLRDNIAVDQISKKCNNDSTKSL